MEEYGEGRKEKGSEEGKVREVGEVGVASETLLCLMAERGD